MRKRHLTEQTFEAIQHFHCLFSLGGHCLCLAWACWRPIILLTISLPVSVPKGSECMTTWETLQVVGSLLPNHLNPQVLLICLRQFASLSKAHADTQAWTSSLKLRPGAE